MIFRFSLILLLTSSNVLSQTNAGEMINIKFKTIEKNSKNIISGTATEVWSGNYRIGFINGDFDGISQLDICSKQIVNKKVVLKIYGMKCEYFEKEYLVNGHLDFIVDLKYGKTKFQKMTNKELFLYNLGLPTYGDCDGIRIISPSERLENANYEHCDGRTKKLNEIPKEELNQWFKIRN